MRYGRNQRTVPMKTFITKPFPETIRNSICFSGKSHYTSRRTKMATIGLHCDRPEKKGTRICRGEKIWETETTGYYKKNSRNLRWKGTTLKNLFYRQRWTLLQKAIAEIKDTESKFRTSLDYRNTKYQNCYRLNHIADTESHNRKKKAKTRRRVQVQHKLLGKRRFGNTDSRNDQKAYNCEKDGEALGTLRPPVHAETSSTAR